MKTETLQKIEPAAATDFSAEKLMELAISSGGEQAVAIIERLMPIRRELNAEKAKRAFAESLAAFQSACPVIIKRKPGASNAYKYAPMEDILEGDVDGKLKVKDLLANHGFSHQTDTEVDSGWVKVLVKVRHALGHEETTSFRCPIDERTKLQTAPQQYASALTFAQRYAFCKALGITVAGEDMHDRLRAASKVVDPEVKILAGQLWALLKPVRGTESNWDAANRWLWDQQILDGGKPDDVAPHLSVARFKEVLGKVRKHSELEKLL